MPPVFIKQGVRLNASMYRNILREKAVPWMKEVAREKKILFQQDSAPAHKAKKVCKFLKDNVDIFWAPKVWPSNSPDLNPCDYYLWGRVETEACSKSHKSVANLEATITSVMANLDSAEVANAISSFRTRVERCIDANGGHFE